MSEQPLHPFSAAVYFQQVTCKIEKRIILDQISLTMKQGTITGILGPNGAGKTTLLSLIMGLRRPSSGTITVFHEKLAGHNNKLRRKIGVVFQETALYDELTTFENLQFAASLYQVSSPEHRIKEVLELLALSERAQDRVRTLSGGLQRRVAIARALLHSPDLLIIDEPTLGVDVEARHAIWSHLRFLKSAGTTIIVSTNYLDEALALCDRVAVLRAGKLLTYETPDTLVARAGSCLDIECEARGREVLTQALSGIDGILRIHQTPSGISLFLTGDIVPEEVMRKVFPITAIRSFRIRGADLAEVFRAFDEVSP
ncbi:MAG TPA: ABC transporter ATP-binding protein [Ktedonobacteraceae bacterium]|jgi:ABC-2 type transport system ATP-binding protein